MTFPRISCVLFRGCAGFFLLLAGCILEESEERGAKQVRGEQTVHLLVVLQEGGIPMRQPPASMEAAEEFGNDVLARLATEWRIAYGDDAVLAFDGPPTEGDTGLVTPKAGTKHIEGVVKALARRVFALVDGNTQRSGVVSRVVPHFVSMGQMVHAASETIDGLVKTSQADVAQMPIAAAKFRAALDLRRASLIAIAPRQAVDPLSHHVICATSRRQDGQVVTMPEGIRVHAIWPVPGSVLDPFEASPGEDLVWLKVYVEGDPFLDLRSDPAPALEELSPQERVDSALWTTRPAPARDPRPRDESTDLFLDIFDLEDSHVLPEDNFPSARPSRRRYPPQPVVSPRGPFDAPTIQDVQDLPRYTGFDLRLARLHQAYSQKKLAELLSQIPQYEGIKQAHIAYLETERERTIRSSANAAGYVRNQRQYLALLEWVAEQYIPTSYRPLPLAKRYQEGSLAHKPFQLAELQALRVFLSSLLSAQGAEASAFGDGGVQTSLKVEGDTAARLLSKRAFSYLLGFSVSAWQSASGTWAELHEDPCQQASIETKASTLAEPPSVTLAGLWWDLLATCYRGAYCESTGKSEARGFPSYCANTVSRLLSQTREGKTWTQLPGTSDEKIAALRQALNLLPEFAIDERGQCLDATPKETQAEKAPDLFLEWLARANRDARWRTYTVDKPALNYPSFGSRAVASTTQTSSSDYWHCEEP